MLIMRLISVLFFIIWVDVNALSTTPAKGFGAPKASKLLHTPDLSCQQLTEKLLESGATLKGVEIGTYNGRRGLFATKNISADKIICKIPSDLALALSDPAQGGQDCPTMAHCGANYLAKFAHAKEWEFYTSSLPSVPPVTPDLYSDEEVALLEYPPLLTAVHERRDAIDQVAAQVGVDRSDLQRCTALVSSRSFSLAIADDDDAMPTADPNVNDGIAMMDDRGQVITKAGERQSIRVLVPFIDMANHGGSTHKANAKLTIIDAHKDDAWFALTATRKIPMGREICLFYGDTSDSLLLNYGIVEENSMDKYMLKKHPFSDWTTTLAEDEEMLKMLEGDEKGDVSGNLSSVLKLRIQLKKSQMDN